MCRDIRDCAPGYYCDSVTVIENTEYVYKNICKLQVLDGEICFDDS